MVSPQRPGREQSTANDARRFKGSDLLKGKFKGSDPLNAHLNALNDSRTTDSRLFGHLSVRFG